MNKLLLPVGAILLSLCCCPFGAVAPNLATEEPKKEFVIGAYELSGQRIVKETVVNDNVSYIEIFSDQTCNLVNFPVFVEASALDYKFQKLYTGKCTWEITTIGGTNKGGEILPVWGVCFSAIDFEPAVKCANLMKSGNLYDLEFVFGDPDSYDTISFRKPSPK